MIIKTSKESLSVGTSIYAAGDALGTKVSFDVPDDGIIVGFVLTDVDDEASVTVNVWIFESEPTGITANDAFALADADLELVQGVVLLDTDFDAANGLVKYEQHTVPYRTDGGKLWVQCEVESGTPTFTATTDVKLQLVIST